MFSTVLTQVTGFFDRRSLLSAYFPSLFLLGGGLIIVLTGEIGAEELVGLWDRQPATVQTVLVVGFLAAVGFWTVALINLRDALDRLYQGYWPRWAAIAPLVGQRKRHYERLRADLLARDRVLESRAAVVRGEQDDFPRPEDFHGLDESTAAPDDGPDLDRTLAELESRITTVVGADPHSATVTGLSALLRRAWTLAARNAASSAAPHEWMTRVEQLSSVTERADAALTRAGLQLQDHRAQVQRDLFLRLPPTPVSPLPTALGNVLRAAELYPWQRYRLDAVVVWSRLQPLLPTEFAELLQQAKTSVDALLTLATLVTLVGLPLGIWTAVRTAWPPTWSASVILCVVTLVLALPFLIGRGRRPPIRLAAAAAVVLVPAPIVLAQLAGAELAVVVARVWTAMALTAAVLLVAWVLYRNGVEAALNYAEKLRTAFDLHRTRVLEQLRLRLPMDIAQERAMWEELAETLYRGTTPGPATAAYATAASPTPEPPTVVAWVPAHPVPPLWTITEPDLAEVRINPAEIPAGAALAPGDLIGMRPLVALAAGVPVAGHLLVGPDRLLGRVIVGVTVRGPVGTTRPGDIVELRGVRMLPGRRTFSDVLVLAVEPLSGSPGRLAVEAAVPASEAAWLLTTARRSDVALSRTV